MIEIFARSVHINRPRYILTGLAIMAATAFMLTCYELGQYGREAIMNSSSTDYGRSTAVVTPASDSPDRDVATEIAALESVGEVYRQSSHTARVRHGGKTADFTAFNTPDEAFGFSQLISGKMPVRADQIAITQSLSTTLDLQVGDTITVAVTYFNEQDDVTESFSANMAVTGIYTPLASSLMTETDMAGYVTDSASAQWTARERDNTTPFTEDIYVTAASGYSDAQVLSDLSHIPEVIVQSRTTAAQTRTNELLDSAKIISATMVIFGAFIVVLASMVIWNAFQVTTAAQRRSLATLRCLGASGLQIWALILTEALILGVSFAALGLACGIALSHFIPSVVRVPNQAWEIPISVTIHPQFVLLAFVTCVATTVIAAIPPAYQAMANAPLAALRNDHVPTSATGRRSRRLVPGLALMTVGIGAAIFGTRMTQLDIGVESAMVCIGVGGLIWILGGLILLPLLPQYTALPFLRLLRRILPRSRSFTVDFLTSSIGQSPRRSGITTVGLLLTTALLSGVTVLASSARTTLLSNLDAAYSYDIDVVQAVSSDGVPLGLSAEQIRAVDTSPHVLASLPVYTSEVETNAERFEFTSVQAFDPKLAEKVISDNSGLRTLTRGMLLLPKTSINEESDPLASSARRSSVKITGPEGASIELDVSYAAVKQPTMALSDLAKITDVSKPAGLWVSVDESQASTTQLASTVASNVNAVSGSYPPSVTSGMLRQHEAYRSATIKMTDVFFVHLIIMTLLAAMGVTNTVGLSLIERRRDTMLIRALGQTRHGIFRSLIFEQLTLGGVGAIIGTFLGVGFSTVIVTTLFGSVATGADVQTPWSSIALILVLELAATVALTLISTSGTLRKRYDSRKNSGFYIP
ncbi:MAG: FtsX-like permease family protein [Actinomycetaceae bacterium]|nr:FtsX-like permease family protein [Actinomycetaceae bacterium]